MAISGSLQLGAAGEGGPTWRIINMTYEFFQPVDRFGQPNGAPTVVLLILLLNLRRRM